MSRSRKEQKTEGALTQSFRWDFLLLFLHFLKTKTFDFLHATMRRTLSYSLLRYYDQHYGKLHQTSSFWLFIICYRFTDLIFTRVLLPKRGKGLFASPESHHHDLYKAASVGPVSVHRPLNSALSCPGNLTQDGKAQGKEMRIQHLKPFSFLRRNVTEDESSILCTTTQRREWSHWHWP